MELDPTLPVFTPDRREPAMVHGGLRCRCGELVFRLSGWPRAISGDGSFFWRTLARVWREARIPTVSGEPIESPFWLPIFARCRQCDREEVLFDGDSGVGHMPAARRHEPRESYRCRVCRRSGVEIVVGVARDPRLDAAPGGAPDDRAALEVVARCHSCHRQARLAFFDGRASIQEIRLDLLYGRR
jgi:hypothetical protein